MPTGRALPPPPAHQLPDSMLSLLSKWRLAVIVVAMGSLGAAPLQDLSPATGVTAWFCPMHPEVTAPEGGRCRKCGMALVAGNPFDTREYSLDVSTTPAVVKAGVPLAIRLTVRHPGTGARITSFEVVHEKRYHLFLVSRDMNVFEHIHPEQ